MGQPKVIDNVSSRKNHTNQNVSKLQIYLDYIVNNIPHFVFWKDVEAVFLGCNKKFSDSVKFKSPEDVIGKTDYDMPWKKEESDTYIADDKLVMESGIPKLNYEERQRQADGSERTMLVSKVPMYGDDDQIIGVLGIYTDITERKKMEADLLHAKERAEAASHAKSMFLANMSHDIKTPIAGIVSTAEYLMHTMQDSEDKSRADDIVQSGLRLLDLMIELIEISRLDVQETTGSQIRFSLKQLIKEIVQLIKPAMSDKQLILDQKYDNKIPQYLVGNRWHLFRILLNLVSNAIKFTKAGKITIGAQLAKQKEQEAIIKISIKDTGIGIPKGKEAIIFEQFSRLTPSYEGIYKGSGLGLYIVKQFVESMDGEIYVESEEGKGSTFICVIPLKIPLIQEDVVESETVSEPQRNSNVLQQIQIAKIQEKISLEATESIKVLSSPITVLLVEDNVIAARAAKANLQALGCIVDHASTGKDAIGFFEAGKYDLVFMDLGLPDMSGIEVASKILETERSVGFNKTPIIALSAHVDEGTKKSCINCGMIDALTKPLLINKAKLILDKVTKIKQLTQKNEKPTEAEKVLTKKFRNIDTGSLKVIDLELGASIIGSDIKTAKEMIGMLIETFPESRNEMEMAYQKKDFKQLEKSTHKTHGGVSYTGAVKLKKALRILVDTIRANNLDEVDKLYKNACSEMDELIKAYKKL